MTAHQLAVVVGLSLVGFGGTYALRQYSVTADVLGLVASYCLYGLSNALLILLISQTGLARAVVVAGAAQIVLGTCVGAFVFGERVGPDGWLAAALARAAVTVAALNQRATASLPIQSSPQTEEVGHEHGDD